MFKQLTSHLKSYLVESSETLPDLEDPLLAPDILKQYAEHPDLNFNTKAKIARNPNTPASSLWDLWHAGHDISKNDAFDLLLLNHDEIPLPTATIIAKLPLNKDNVTKTIKPFLVQHPNENVRAFLARFSEEPSIQDAILDRGTERDHSFLIENPRFPKQKRFSLYEKYKTDPFHPTHVSAALSPFTPPELLHHYIKDKYFKDNDQLHDFILDNESLSDSHIQDLYQNISKNITKFSKYNYLERLIHLPNISDSLLAHMKTDTNLKNRMSENYHSDLLHRIRSIEWNREMNRDS